MPDKQPGSRETTSEESAASTHNHTGETSQTVSRRDTSVHIHVPDNILYDKESGGESQDRSMSDMFGRLTNSFISEEGPDLKILIDAGRGKLCGNSGVQKGLSKI